MLPILFSLVFSLQAPPPQRPPSPDYRLTFPPSTMSDPVYVTLPITIEIVNMTPQVLSDLVASGKIVVDGANHLNIPSGPAAAKLGPDMLRPQSQTDRIPATSADRPLKQPTAHPLLVAAPIKFAIVAKGKVTLTVEGNRLVLKEITDLR